MIECSAARLPQLLPPCLAIPQRCGDARVSGDEVLPIRAALIVYVRVKGTNKLQVPVVLAKVQFPLSRNDPSMLNAFSSGLMTLYIQALRRSLPGFMVWPSLTIIPTLAASNNVEHRLGLRSSQIGLSSGQPNCTKSVMENPTASSVSRDPGKLRVSLALIRANSSAVTGRSVSWPAVPG